MPTKRIYRRISVKQVELESLREEAIKFGDVGTCVGLDIAKGEIVLVVRWGEGNFERPWSVKNPSEIDLLIERLLLLKETSDSLTIGLESTGTYGEAVRYAMTAAGLEVHRVSGKKVSDYKEIFDGVPSQHDGKDAAMIAELTAYGKGAPWPWQARSQEEQQLSHHVQRLYAFRNQSTQWTGRLEGLVAKHWPEVSSLLTLHSVTLLNVLLKYGSPARLAADPEAAQQLQRWGRSIKKSKVAKVLESARTTLGVPMNDSEVSWIGEVAHEILAAQAEVSTCTKQLQQIAQAHPTMSKYVEKVGAVTLCVIWHCVGDPRQYSSSGAFLKALGLNLKELSSGKYQGKLAITKRGPSLSRKFLFFWALRAVQQPGLKKWYEDFQKVGKPGNSSSAHRKMKGLVAMMRKLSRSLWYTMQHDLEFEYGKVFPGQPLEKRKVPHRRRQRRGASVGSGLRRLHLVHRQQLGNPT